MSSPHRDESPEAINWSERLEALFDRHRYPGTKKLLVGLLIVSVVAGMTLTPWVFLLVPVWLGRLFFVKESSAGLAQWRAEFIKGFQEDREAVRRKRDAKLQRSYRQTAIKGATKGVVIIAVIALFFGVLAILSWLSTGKPDLRNMPLSDLLAIAAMVAVFAAFLASWIAVFDLSELAAMRREYPLLALPHLAITGAMTGALASGACCYLWHSWLHDIPSREAIWPSLEIWALIGAVIGGIGHPWWRFVGGVGNSIDFLANAAMRGKAVVVGAFWAALGGLVSYITWNYAFKSYEPDGATMHWVLVVIGGCLGFYWGLGRGVGPIWNALTGPPKLTKADLVHGTANLADEDDAARAARGGRR